MAYEQCVKLWVGLFQQGDPIEERYKEFTDRSSVIDQLAYCINSYREAALSSDPKFDHIDIAEKQKVPTCFILPVFLPLYRTNTLSLSFLVYLLVLQCSPLIFSRFWMSVLMLKPGWERKSSSRMLFPNMLLLYFFWVMWEERPKLLIGIFSRVFIPSFRMNVTFFSPPGFA